MKDGLCSLGIDVGSVTLKLALLDEFDSLLYESYEKHHGRPAPTLLAALRRLAAERPGPGPMTAAVTGSGKGAVADVLEIQPVNEIVAQAVAVARLHPGARTIIEIGGQDSKLIRLGPDERDSRAVVLDQRMNDICAAGTGAFVERQADRMQIPVAEFGPEALRARSPALVAGRCAVFSKTDIIHLQQEGVAKCDVAAGVCNAVVRNYVAQFSKGRSFERPVVFQGGLAANRGVVKAFKQALGVADGEMFVPEHFRVMAAMGAALMACEDRANARAGLDQLIGPLAAHLERQGGAEARCSRLPRLVRDTHRIPGCPESQHRIDQRVLVGIDVGSTSTCIALLTEGGRLLADSYILNSGDVIDSVNSAMDEVCAKLGDDLDSLRVIGAGVTGSGRHLVSEYVGADVVKDEITAQARAAVHMLPEVDTVFEIGGQDSKYIRISGGRVVDFEMNKVCAAGTGSFLQEQAHRLQEEIGGLSDLAFASEAPADLGSRCTVFMESDLVNYQQTNIPKEDLIAGLSYSVARNYIEKVVAGKPVGEKVLLLGGIAFNDSVVAAFQQILGKKLLVPRHHETSAAVGMALLAREEISAREAGESRFLGFRRRRSSYGISSFQCAECPNACRIRKVEADGSTFFYGGACGRYERKASTRDLPNPFREREALMLGYHCSLQGGARGRIGIPRAQLFYEFFPLWCTFLQEMGYEVVVSDPTNKEILGAGLERSALDNCVASKLVYGHVQNLIEKGVERIFFPAVIEFERQVRDIEHNYSCPHVQTMPDLVRTAFPSLEVISPVFVREVREGEWRGELRAVGRRLGGDPRTVKRAIARAAQAQLEFREKCEQLGRRLLAELPPDAPAAVLMGKIYEVCDPGLNLRMADKLISLGAVPVPYDCLPLTEQRLPDNYRDLVWAPGQDLIRTAKIVLGDRRLNPVLITNFCCVPDSFALKYLDELFRERPFLVLEIDEHTSDVGITTRLEAFLNNLQQNGAGDFEEASRVFKPFVGSSRIRKFDRLLYVPRSFHSYLPMAAAFEGAGIRTKLLPEDDKEAERLGRMYSSGKECTPYIMYVGNTVTMTRDPEFHPDRSALFIPSTNLGCRVSLLPTSLRKVLHDLGYPQVPVIAPRISADTDEVISAFGPRFEQNIYRGVLAIELLARRGPEIRPYEKQAGAADSAYRQGVEEVCRAMAEGGDFWGALRGAVDRFDRIEVDGSPSRPVVGLIGDDYSRANDFANNDFIKGIEALGGEVRTVSVLSRFVDFNNGLRTGKMLRRGRVVRLGVEFGKLLISTLETSRARRVFDGRLKCFPDPTYSQMLEMSSKFLDARTEPLILIMLSHVLELMKSGVDGIANLIGFQCAIYSIISAALRPLYEAHGNPPVLNLFLDFQESGHQRNRMEAFMHQVKQFRERRVGRPPPAFKPREASRQMADACQVH